MKRALREIAPWLGTATILAGLGVALALCVAWLGIVNIAASAGHPAWVESFLELTMTRSVQRHSRDLVPPADLRSLDRIRLGAAHFAGGCAECHGAPDTVRNPVYDHMLPVPPDLAVRAPHWDARELFFIVRNGLQFTGMPEWSGGSRADEVWSVVAFLQELPTLDEPGYRALAAGNGMPPAPHSVTTLREEGVAALARAACDRCHDTAESAPPSNLVPRLAGQPAAYLERSLREYRSGERRSGFMQPVAAVLSGNQIEQLAVHYSRMPLAPAPASESGPQDEAALIARGMHPGLRLPACLSCHGADARADYPVLAGQQAEYMAQQLRLWQSGGRRESAWGEVMGTIAGRLDAAQIDLLAQWFAQQSRPPGPE